MRVFQLSVPFAVVVTAFLVTGCPHNQYIVQLKPQGNAIERTLIFYREDGVNTNTAVPNYQPFETGELAAITALYPVQGVTNDGERYVVRGEFTHGLPDDIGGAGVYTNLATSLGEAGFYSERFRGNDNLADMAERRFKAADRLADLAVGWSQVELDGKPGYDKLHQFLNVDFRRDLKNFGMYLGEGRLVNSYKTNASDEFDIRFCQYLYERGYFTRGEIPGLVGDVSFADVSGNDLKPLLRRVQRVVARKMGVPDTEPVPASLAFLADETMVEKSYTNYLASTEAYRAELKQWETDKKLNPDSKQPQPSDLVDEAVRNLVGIDLSEEPPDHLTVQLSLPSSPLHSNGRWDEVLKQMVWESDIEGRTNAVGLPFFCYATWVQADEEFQKEHLGKVVLNGDDLMQYCLWRCSQDATHGDEWDAFVAGLEPGTNLMAKVAAFRFTDETNQPVTNGQQNIPIPSAYPRELLKTALQ